MLELGLRWAFRDDGVGVLGPDKGLAVFVPAIENPVMASIRSPTVASVICRLVLREGFRDVSFRFGGVRTLGFVAAAVAFPVVIGLVA